MSNRSAKSIPLLSLVRAPIGWSFVNEFIDFEITNEISEWESITGNVFEFRAMSVNPELAATTNPFEIVSRSSKPGSPKDTLLSNHPFETCKFSSTKTGYLFGFLSLLEILVMKPFSTKISWVLLWKSLFLSRMVADFISTFI